MKFLPYAIVVAAVFLLSFFYILAPPPLPAGDVAEYYGITQTLSHFGLDLRQEDISAMEPFLGRERFSNPQYYIEGRGSNRYPIHFIAYSLLLMPMRVLTQVLDLPSLLVFPLSNSVIIALTLLILLRRYVHKFWQQMLLIAVFLTSPLLFFIPWQGPDLFYVCALLIAVFAFFNKDYLLAFAMTALSSWHSQPLIILGLVQAVHLLFIKKKYLYTILIGTLYCVPYLYNLYFFGVLSPWTLIADGWTQQYGFGIQNMSLWKLYEQFFDLNIGLWWYAPALLTMGAAGLYAHAKGKKITWWVIGAFVLTAFFYHTNPAWHYGTAGYGPGRHALFFLPLFIFGALAFPYMRYRKAVIIAGGLIFLQLYSLTFNHWIFPDFTDTLRHSPYARYVLTQYPRWYNPTPEIFTDRSNQTDPLSPVSAVFRVNGACRKAYVRREDGLVWLKNQCGFIPETYNTLQEGYVVY